MRSSGESLALLSRIDQLLVSEHYYLNLTDECWFLREYASGKGYQHGETNSLISNLKKPVDRRGKPEWKYKEEAIMRIAGELSASLNPDWLQNVTLAPMPPSRVRTDPLPSPQRDHRR